MVMFQMYDGYRALLIEEHLFYTEQAKKLLLSQFNNIDEMAQSAVDEFVSKRYFDPETDDSSSLSEAAYDQAIEFGLLLSNLRERTLLSVIAGMAQEMEKKLRAWMARELLWHLNGQRRTVEWAWRAKWEDLVILFHGLGWEIQRAPFYNDLEAMMLVVNVCKHGSGSSFDRLKAEFPMLLREVGAGEFQFHHDYLAVDDTTLETFSLAVVEFWKAMPATLGEMGTPVPGIKKLQTAYREDHEALDRISAARRETIITPKAD